MALAAACLFEGTVRAQDAEPTASAEATQASADSAVIPEASAELTEAAPPSAEATPEQEVAPPAPALPTPVQEPPAPVAVAPQAEPVGESPAQSPPPPPPQCPALPAADAEAPLPEVSPLAGKHFLAQAYTALQVTFGAGELPEHDLNLGTLGFEAGSSMLVGPRFPGFEGGQWHGGLIRPSAGLHTGVALLTPLELDNVQPVTLISVGATLGYQFLHFEPLKKTSQVAYGASAGYRFGYQYTIALTLEELTTARAGDMYQGIGLTLVRATYHPAEKNFGLLLLSLSFDRMASSDINLFKLSIGRGF